MNMSVLLIHLFVLIVIANGMPIIARKMLGDKWNLPVDGGLVFIDQKRLFGASKTWRGLLSALLVTGLAAVLLGYEISTGLLIAAAAMLGDLLTSFSKRRMNLPASSMAPLFDQLLESLLPALLMMQMFTLNYLSVLLLVTGFVVFDLIFSRLLYKIGLRRRPY